MSFYFPINPTNGEQVTTPSGQVFVYSSIDNAWRSDETSSSDVPLSIFKIGVATSIPLYVTGGVAPYTYFVSEGSLPVGIVLNSSLGVISGTASMTGPYEFTISVTDSAGDSGFATFIGTIGSNTSAPPAGSITITPSSLSLVVGTAFNTTLTASGGTSPYTYAVQSGTLPTGLGLTNGGVLGGTPTTAGAYTFTVAATDSNLKSGQVVYSGSVTAASSSGITISPSSFSGWAAGTFFSQSLAAAGGTSPYTYSVTSGTLPAGVSLATGGLISGTPTTAGGYSFAITATDSASHTGVQSYSGTISTGITISPSTLPALSQNVPITSITLSAVGGTGPYTYSISSGSLPAGLILVAGTISGTPTAIGAYAVTIQVSDSASHTATVSYTGTVATDYTLTFSPTVLPAMAVGTGVYDVIQAAGGLEPTGYTYSVSAGALPAGLTFAGGTTDATANEGILTGTPTTVGSYNFTIYAINNIGNPPASGSQTYTGSVGAAGTLPFSGNWTPTSLAFSNGVAISVSFVVTGGTYPYTYSISSGSLPAGVSLSSSGLLSGTPAGSAGASYNFTVKALDATGKNSTTSFSGVLSGVAISISTSGLTSGTYGVAYSKSLSASGGTAPYTYSISSGSLPSGLTLTSAGVVSGTPTVTGGFLVYFAATDAAGNSAIVGASINIAAAVIVITGTSPSTGTVGTAFTGSVSATGGVGAPYTFTASSGLPLGVTLSSSGTYSGTPTTAAVYGWIVTATDSNSSSANAYFSTTISPVSAGITISPSSIPAWTVGVSNSVTFSATGGTAPYTFTKTAGAFAPGLSFSGATLSGVPSSTVNESFQLTATDSLGHTVTQGYSMVVGSGASGVSLTLALSGTSTYGGTAAYVGETYLDTVIATGGTGSYTFKIVSGSLPPGMALTTGGGLQGIVNTAGTYSAVIQATDTANDVGTMTYNITVTSGGGLTVTTQTIPSIPLGWEFPENPLDSQTWYQGVCLNQSSITSITGGNAPYFTNLTNGYPPPGIWFGLSYPSAGGGVLGIPTVKGTYNFELTLNDNAGKTGKAECSVTVIGPGATMSISPAGPTLPHATYGQPYSVQFTASGGTAPYTFSAPIWYAGRDGLTLSSTGLFSGTLTNNGLLTFALIVTDADGNTTGAGYGIPNS